MSRRRKIKRDTPIMPAMCQTCPFRLDAPDEFQALRPALVVSAMTEASRICHSSGKCGIFRKVAKQHICRGARNVQLNAFFKMGFIEAPTDEAWNKKRQEIGV